MHLIFYQPNGTQEPKPWSLSDEVAADELLDAVDEVLLLGVSVEAVPVEVLPEEVLPVEAVSDEPPLVDGVSDGASDGASEVPSVEETSDFESPLPTTDEADGVLDGLLSFELSLQATRTVNKRHIVTRSAISFFIKILLM